MLRHLLSAAIFCCVACGSSAGSAGAVGDDANGSDSQIGGTDATGTDASPGTDAASDVLPDADTAVGTDAITPDTAPDTASDIVPDVAPDIIPDVPASACAPTYEGAIPGAVIDLSKTPCTFSISGAKGVFNLPYKLTISSVEKLSIGGNLGGCPPQAESIHGGIATFEVIGGGNSQKWCLCDTGLCAPTTPPFTPSVPGSYSVNFTWDGNNWYGPSDTGNKPGPAFPPGSYVFSVEVKGDHEKADGSVEAFSAVAKLPITLTP